MFRELGYLPSSQRDTGELGNGVKHNGDRGFICHTPVMRDQHFWLVRRFVVVGRLHQRRVIAKFCRALCAFIVSAVDSAPAPASSVFPFAAVSFTVTRIPSISARVSSTDSPVEPSAT